MDHSSPFRLAFSRERSSPPQQSIDERSAPVAGCGVHYHAGRLVDYEQRLILVYDADRNVLASDGPLFDSWDVDPDDLADLGTVARFLAPPVNQNVPLRDQCCRLGARKLGALGNKEVEADIAVRLDRKLSGVAQSLDLGSRIRHRGGGNDGRGRSLLSPENPCQQEGTNAHRHVGDVEGRPPEIADSNVDEVNYASRGSDAIDEISNRSAAHKSQCHRAEKIARAGGPVQPSQDYQCAGCERHEDPPRVDAQVQSECGTGVVHEREPEMIPEYLVRNVLRRQRRRRDQLRREIEYHHRDQRAPEEGRIRLGAFHLLRAACTRCNIWRAAARRDAQS